MRALVAGWFSFPWYGATAGDLLAAVVVGNWLDEAGCPYDVALVETLGTGVDAMTVDAMRYTHLVFVCGPLGEGEPVLGLLQRFKHARTIGLDLTMLHPIEQWQPFDLLLERDSDRTARPDISLLADVPELPVIALVLAHEQKEYPLGRHREVHETARAALAAFDAAVVEVDTCLDPPNAQGLSSPAKVLAVLSRADAVVTTRLHGLVLALKVGVPVVAIDPVANGAKVARQAAALGWNEVLVPEQTTIESVTAALVRCLELDAKPRAQACAHAAADALAEVRETFLNELVGD
jgi:hypothetical protein